MKTNLLKIAVIAAMAVSATALPAKADKYYKTKKVKKTETKVTVNVVNTRPGYYGHGRGPRPVYVAPRPVYVAPRPVYVAPQPVYVAPRPVYTTRPVYASSVELDVQRALAKRGYYGGVIDGDIGPRSRAAIRTYQVDKGLPVTGMIDGALLRSLRLL